ncbi:hypothetical protein [Thermoanaerobacter siderophilus]|uniref:hypothetical protein n=1 Tax=Thermoanaerobacter siderophilus TaxID=106578 RepID=UPI001FCB1286|nr:hypothetical protein [Thermoanaerobacter siderophilus]
MAEVINSNDVLIQRIKTILKNKKNSTINIVNDKLTLSVFSELQFDMEKVKEINLVLRDSTYIPTGKEISREFEIGRIADNIFFNSYEIVEKNKLGHLSKARSMYNFIEKHVNVKRIKKKELLKSNFILIDEDYGVFGDSSLEIIRKTRKNGIVPMNFNIEITDSKQVKELKRGFEIIWNNKGYTEDFKKQLLENLNFIYKEYDPEFLYFLPFMNFLETN